MFKGFFFDHEKIVLLLENILNRKRYQKQGSFTFKKSLCGQSGNYCEIMRFLLDSARIQNLSMI